MSILGEEEIHFDDPDLEDERRMKTKELLKTLATAQSHAGWFDEAIFGPLVVDYIKCSIHVRELDKLVMNDPVTYGGLDRIRNNTITRLGKLRMDLGITATKISSMTPKKAAPRGGLDALAEAVDADFTE